MPSMGFNGEVATPPRDKSEKLMKVFLRIRPAAQRKDVLSDSETNFVRKVDSMTVLLEPLPNTGGRQREDRFSNFSEVFSQNSGQAEIYEAVLSGMVVKLVREDASGLLMAYGASNAGKSYTIFGDRQDPGLLLRALQKVFDMIAEHGCSNTRSQQSGPKDEEPASRQAVWLSMFEFYSNMSHRDCIYDLLHQQMPERSRQGALSLEDGQSLSQMFVRNVTSVPAYDVEEALEIISRGSSNRRTQTTGANETSSRSHCAITIRLSPSPVSATYEAFRGQMRNGQLTIIDLAGAERNADTQNVGVQLKESTYINTSFMEIGRCFRELVEAQENKREPSPVSRGLNIIWFLKYYFLGCYHTALMVNVSPCQRHWSQTQHVLQCVQSFHALKIAPPRSMRKLVPLGSVKRPYASMAPSHTPAATGNAKSTNEVSQSCKRFRGRGPSETGALSLDDGPGDRPSIGAIAVAVNLERAAGEEKLAKAVAAAVQQQREDAALRESLLRSEVERLEAERESMRGQLEGAGQREEEMSRQAERILEEMGQLREGRDEAEKGRAETDGREAEAWAEMERWAEEGWEEMEKRRREVDVLKEEKTRALQRAVEAEGRERELLSQVDSTRREVEVAKEERQLAVGRAMKCLEAMEEESEARVQRAVDAEARERRLQAEWTLREEEVKRLSELDCLEEELMLKAEVQALGLKLQAERERAEKAEREWAERWAAAEREQREAQEEIQRLMVCHEKLRSELEECSQRHLQIQRESEFGFENKILELECDRERLARTLAEVVQESGLASRGKVSGGMEAPEMDSSSALQLLARAGREDDVAGPLLGMDMPGSFPGVPCGEDLIPRAMEGLQDPIGPGEELPEVASVRQSAPVVEESDWQPRPVPAEAPPCPPEAGEKRRRRGRPPKARDPAHEDEPAAACPPVKKRKAAKSRSLQEISGDGPWGPVGAVPVRRSQRGKAKGVPQGVEVVDLSPEPALNPTAPPGPLLRCNTGLLQVGGCGPAGSGHHEGPAVGVRAAIGFSAEEAAEGRSGGEPMGGGGGDKCRGEGEGAAVALGKALGGGPVDEPSGRDGRRQVVVGTTEDGRQEAAAEGSRVEDKEEQGEEGRQAVRETEGESSLPTRDGHSSLVELKRPEGDGGRGSAAGGRGDAGGTEKGDVEHPRDVGEKENIPVSDAGTEGKPRPRVRKLRPMAAQPQLCKVAEEGPQKFPTRTSKRPQEPSGLAPFSPLTRIKKGNGKFPVLASRGSAKWRER